MAKKKTTKKPASGFRRVEFSIARHFPEDQTAILANNVVIQNDGPEFHILFFQTHPPIILDSEIEPARMMKAVEAEGGVKSLCVARVVISAMRMQSFIDALQENYQKFLQMANDLKEEKREQKNGQK